MALNSAPEPEPGLGVSFPWQRGAWGLALVAAAGLLWLALSQQRPAVVPKSPERPSLPSAPSKNAEPAAYLGVLLSEDLVEVEAQSEGLLVRLNAQFGADVKQDEVLAVIDDRGVRARLDEAKGALKGAESELERLRIESQQLEQRRQTMEQAQGSIEHETGGAHPRTPGRAPYSDYELSDARNKERIAHARLEGAQALRAEKEAQVRQAETALAMTVIRAPFAGVVAARYLSIGGMVRRGTPILRLVGVRSLFARFAVPAAVASEFGKGRQVRITGIHASEWLARVARIAPELDAAAQLVIVEAALETPLPAESLILVGQQVQVVLK